MENGEWRMENIILIHQYTNIPINNRQRIKNENSDTHKRRR